MVNHLSVMQEFVGTQTHVYHPTDIPGRVLLLELVAWHKINREKGVYRDGTEYLIINCKSSQSSV